MAQPNFSVMFFAAAAIAGSGSVGQAIVDAGSDTYAIATSTARTGGKRSSYIIVGLGHPLGAYTVQSCGDISPSITGLAPGAASWVRVSTTGAIERCTPGVGDDVIGWCEASGLLHLQMGYLTSSITAGGSGLPTWLTALTESNTAGSVSPGVGGSPASAPSTENFLRFTSGGTTSDWLNWGAGTICNTIFGNISFGPEANCCPSGALRFPGVTNARCMLMGAKSTAASGPAAGANVLSIINISSVANGLSPSLEIGREYWEQTLIYGGRYIINVINPGVWGDGSVAWYWEIEGYGYQVQLQPLVASGVITWVYGSLFGTMVEQATARATTGTSFTRRAGQGTGGGSVGGLNRLEGGVGVATGGAIELAGGQGAGAATHGAIDMYHYTTKALSVVPIAGPAVGLDLGATEGYLAIRANGGGQAIYAQANAFLEADTAEFRAVDASGAHVYFRAIYGSEIRFGYPLCGELSESKTLQFKSATWTQNTTSDKTLSATEAACPILIPTGTPGGAWNIIAPNLANSVFTVDNRGGTPSAVTIKKSGGTGVTIAASRIARVYHNGTDYVRETADST